MENLYGLYDNLHNYNEEATIAELQSENKELKSKLEDYATNLEKLQKDFDKLTSEYQRLEANYSSLMKTAKAEIQRKTQMITNLNLEKDKIILNAYQNNRNASPFQRNQSYNKPALAQDKDKEDKTERDRTAKDFGKSKTSHIDTKRNDQVPPKYNKTSANTELKKTPSVSSSAQIDPRVKSNSDAKENIVQTSNKEKDALKSRALIKNRRKSMPAVSLGMENISTDEDEYVNQPKSQVVSRASKGGQDRNLSDKQSSRTSETSSLEDRYSVKYGTGVNVHKSRQSRYDNDRIDRYKPRDKSAHRLKRLSPDRNRRGTKDYHDNVYHKSEHDRRRLESPPKDKHKRPSRETRRGSNERRQLEHRYQEHDRVRSQEHDRIRSQEYERHGNQDHDRFRGHDKERLRVQEQERLIMQEQEKLRMQEQEKLRMQEQERLKIKEQQRLRIQEEERLIQERDRLSQECERLMIEDQERLRNKEYENDEVKERYSLKHKIQHDYEEQDSKRKKKEPCHKREEDLRFQEAFNDLDFSSCESPDHNHPDVAHQAREIKLTATMKLDDPRISNKKYVLNKDNGKVTLSITDARNVDIVPLDKVAWGIKPVSIPEALVRRPSMESDPAVTNTDLDDMPVHDVSMESGEIQDHEDSPTETDPALTIQDTNSVNLKESAQKFKSYKIPKIKKSGQDDDTHGLKYTKTNDNQPDKNKQPDTIKKSSDTSQMAVKPIEVDNESMVKFGHVQVQNNKLPSLGNINIFVEQKYPTTKEVVECDLEMSDDACDNEQLNQDSKGKNDCNEIKNNITNTDEPIDKIIIENNTVNVKSSNNDKTQIDKKVTVKPCKESPDEGKKPKNKKKQKPKESKEAKEASDTKPQVTDVEKPTRKKPKETKIKEIKTKFSELFDDSCSLIYPEDLGLSTTSGVSKTLETMKCVPFFEDAQDAVDINSLKQTKVSICNEKQNEKSNYIEDMLKDENNQLKSDDTDSKSVQKPNYVQTEIPDDVVESIYKNLEPGLPEKEADVVKTVIISTGVQPQIDATTNEVVKAPQLATINKVVFKALASSTPHKALPDLVQTKIESKLPESTNASDSIVSVDNTPILDNSDCNKLDSQANIADVPDVRIVVRRRRRVVK